MAISKADARFPDPDLGTPRRRASDWRGWALTASVALIAGLGWYALQVQRALDESSLALQDATLFVNQLSSELETTRRDANMLVDTLRVLQAGDLVLVDLQGQGPTPGAFGRAFVTRGHGVVFHAERLPQPPRGRTYQLWMLPEGASPVSAGTFDVNAFGMSTLATGPAPALTGLLAVSVTDEPGGGSPAPTTTPVLVGIIRN